MNEILLLVTMAVSAAFVFVMWKLGKERLYIAIVVLLILVAVMGSKLVVFFGHTTNAGNVFYAAVFLATYFIIERYGKKEGAHSIWVGITSLIAFSVLIQLSIALIGSETTHALNQALSTAFHSSIRITAASLLAYMVSQNINVFIYIYLKQRMEKKYLWFRANLANAVAQLADSIIFFIIGFFGTVSFPNLWDIVLTGFVIKVVFMMIASPLLYLNKIQEEDYVKYSSITLA